MASNTLLFLLNTNIVACHSFSALRHISFWNRENWMCVIFVQVQYNVSLKNAGTGSELRSSAPCLIVLHPHLHLSVCWSHWLCRQSAATSSLPPLTCRIRMMKGSIKRRCTTNSFAFVAMLRPSLDDFPSIQRLACADLSRGERASTCCKLAVHGSASMAGGSSSAFSWDIWGW